MIDLEYLVYIAENNGFNTPYNQACARGLFTEWQLWLLG